MTRSARSQDLFRARRAALRIGKRVKSTIGLCVREFFVTPLPAFSSSSSPMTTTRNNEVMLNYSKVCKALLIFGKCTPVSRIFASDRGTFKAADCYCDNSYPR
jgi:hypothetical protein